MLKTKGHLTAGTPRGDTPLFAASGYGETDVIKLLLDNKANINHINNDRMTPLLVASWNRKEDNVKLLIERKANLDLATKTGHTPLMCAAYNGSMDAVLCLVESGADINMRDPKEGKTAAEHAYYGTGRSSIAEYLNTRAQQIRFSRFVRDRNNRLCRVKGRSLRAIERDLNESGAFDDHMLHRLKKLCTMGEL